MVSYISGKPSFHISCLYAKKARNEKIFPLISKQSYYFYSARYALAAGLKALDVGPGDKLLFPAYNCGVELDTILHYSIKPEFYKIDKKLIVDIDDLINKISDRVKAIFVTHFLGFPQPIRKIKKICLERNLYLIEDCAHAFLSETSGESLGSFGDIAIFSLIKTLPVPNGGILVINNNNNNNLTHQKPSLRPSVFSTFFYIATLLKHKTTNNTNLFKANSEKYLYSIFYFYMSALRIFLVGFRKLFKQDGVYLARPDSFLFVEKLCSWGISSISKKIVYKTDLKRIKKIRRRNFNYLLNHFTYNNRVKLPVKKLLPGVCPLFFPIIIENPDKREILYKILKSKGVITHPWWERFHSEVSWDEFPDAVYLKKRLFGIPIHQDLNLKHLDRIIMEFEIAHKNL